MAKPFVKWAGGKEKEQVLRKIYDERIQLLNNCDQPINITFEELINKYY